MDIKIYNANQIGGCFTLIQTKQSNILIDYGHADSKMLAAVIEAINPQEKIYPMHTKYVQNFLKLDIFIGDDRKKTKNLRMDVQY